MNVRVPPMLLVLGSIGLSACDRNPAGPISELPVERPTRPVDPLTARAASTTCPDRCAYLLPIEATGGEPRTMSVTDDARVTGLFVDSEGAMRSAFSWSSSSGTRQVVPRTPFEGATPRVWGGNSWGQLVGQVDERAVAWEPDGSPVPLRAGPENEVIRGDAHAINVHSVIVGSGSSSADPRTRAFRWHYLEGFQYLTPEFTSGAALHVTSSGLVVGYWRTSDGPRGGDHMFTWTKDGGFRDEGPGHVRGVSDNGHIVFFRGSWYYLRKPDGTVVDGLPDLPVAVNDWGEVVIDRIAEGCGAGVWYAGYGLLPLHSPDPRLPRCEITSINSWGDVVGTVFSPNGAERRVAVWTWQGNAWRFGH